MDNRVAENEVGSGVGSAAPPTADRVRVAARLVTDVLQPRNTLLVGLITLGAVVARSWTGAAWGLVAAGCAGIVPAAYIQWERRRGTWGDRHVVDRRQRPRIFAVILTSIGAGTALMLAAGAPNRLVVAMLAMWGMTVVLLVVNAAWKISVDCTVASATVALLAVAGGAWWLTGYAGVVAVCWSRVALRYHTLAQTIAGTTLGAAAAAALTLG
ncbi:hypothetical protein [Embleya sp. NBC_00896]|uniref:hypothetical protein n=1 Tax=Embleya sp. NBC_00896 TaxID=2975961 RepID=UPI002F918E69|nr:hypothetical protein OG928_41660 [Embleya sp. NBC_00896]